MAAVFDWESERLTIRMETELRKLEEAGYDFESCPEKRQIRVRIPSRPHLWILFTVSKQYPYHPPKMSLVGEGMGPSYVRGGRHNHPFWSTTMMLTWSVEEIDTAFASFQDAGSRWVKTPSRAGKDSWVLPSEGVSFVIAFEESNVTRVKSASKC